MKITLIDGTKKPINRSVVIRRNKPITDKQGNQRAIKNPLIQFDIAVTETSQRNRLFSTETVAITRSYHVKAFCSIDNKAAIHEDVLLQLQKMPTEQFHDGFITAKGCQYHFTIPHYYTDIYLSEF